MKFVNALNLIHDNIWAIVILAGGLTLQLLGKDGKELMLLGAALLRQRVDKPTEGNVTNEKVPVNAVSFTTTPSGVQPNPQVNP